MTSGMKIKDLIVGEVYTCRISGKKVLILSNNIKTEEINGKEVTYHKISAHWYNEISGYFDSMSPMDYQLVDK